MSKSLFSRGVFTALAGSVLLSYFAVETLIHDNGIPAQAAAETTPLAGATVVSSADPEILSVPLVTAASAPSPTVVPAVIKPEDKLVLATRDLGEARQVGSVTARTINMRAAPNLRSGIVGSYPRATAVEVLSVQDAWVEVKTPDGRTGWMSRKFVDVKTGPALGAAEPSAPAKVAVASADPVVD